MAKHLEDIGKDAKDLLTESYPIAGTLKITAQTKSHGFTPKITLNRSIKKEKSSFREVVTAVLEPKYEINDIEFTAKCSSTTDITVGSSVRNILAQGTKFELSVTRPEKDPINVVAQGSYKNDYLAVKGKWTNYFIPKNPLKFLVNSEAVFHHSGSNSNVGLGVDVNYDERSTQVFAEAVLSHSAVDTQYKGLARYDVNGSKWNLGLSLWHKWTDICNLAFSVLLDDNSSKISVITGCEYKVADSTTLKGKWNVVHSNDRLDYRIGASIKQKVSPNIIATLGTDLNPRAMVGVSNDGDPHSFGLEIKFQE